nr:probable tRNA (guanine(26)-N(2))-dimethyltransferase 1 [Tanacetum cinerariifolium]
MGNVEEDVNNKFDLNDYTIIKEGEVEILMHAKNQVFYNKALVDLDPYGSPSVFLDSAVQSVADGGLLMCIATDMAVLCGSNGEICSYPLRGKYCHEMARRIILACVESLANRYKRYIVPVLSVQMDFYVRVFVRVFTSAGAMKSTPLKLSYVYQCVGCDSFHFQPTGRPSLRRINEGAAVIRTNGEAAAGMFDVRPDRRIVVAKLTKKAILSVTAAERAENVEFRRPETVLSCLKLLANEEDYKFKQALKIETPKNRVNKNLDSRKRKSKCEVGDGVEYLNHYDVKTVKKSHGGWGPDNHRLLLNHLRENKSFMQKRFKKLITENSRN